MQFSQRLKIYRLALRVKRKIYSLLGFGEKKIRMRDRLEQYKEIWQAIANELKADFELIDKDIWSISKNNKIVRTSGGLLPLDNTVVLKICGRKPLCHKLLSANNIPIPEYLLFEAKRIDLALSFMKQHPNGVVVKPFQGSAARGITTHIRTKKELEKAIIIASLYENQLMIEKHIIGENFRALVFRGKVIHTARRTGQRIVGDGQSNISTLLAKTVVQKQPLDKKEITLALASQNLTPDFVPEMGRSILVHSSGKDITPGAELTTNYDSGVTELVHSSINDVAVKCAQITGTELLGVDIITTDITRPLSETGGVVNEINTTPAPHHHYNSKLEKFPEPTLTIIKELLR